MTSEPYDFGLRIDYGVALLTAPTGFMAFPATAVYDLSSYLNTGAPGAYPFALETSSGVATLKCATGLVSFPALAVEHLRVFLNDVIEESDRIDKKEEEDVSRN